MIKVFYRFTSRSAFFLPLLALACCIGVQKDSLNSSSPGAGAIGEDSSSPSGFSLKNAIDAGPEATVQKLREMLAESGNQVAEPVPLKKIKQPTHPDVAERRRHIKKLQRWKSKDRLGKARNLINNFQCDKAPEAVALALVMERDFPNQEVLNRSIDLHRLVIGCDSVLREDSAMRLAVLSLLNKDCETSQMALKAISENSQEIPKDRVTFISNYCVKPETITISNPWSGYGVLLGAPPVKVVSEGPWHLAVQSGDSAWDNKLLKLLELFEKKEFQRMRTIADHFDLNSFSELPRDFQTSIVTLLHFAEADFNVFQLLNRILRNQSNLMSPELISFLYPVRHWELISSHASGIDPLFVKGLIRQESAFNPRARSRAKAVGLMQIIPSVGRVYGIRDRRKLTDPELNVKAGSAFIRSLVKKFGSYELALAAYNAGPNHVRDWLERYPTEDINLFVELMPFEETREYVRLVMRNYRIYQQVLNMGTGQQAAAE